LTLEGVTALLAVLAWPVVALFFVDLLRREITGLFGRVREIEGPGDVKITLDSSKVEQIIEEGRKQNAPIAEVAERIVESAVVLDRREARILRALLDDDDRALYSYQSSYYKAALDSLMTKRYVRKGDKGFALTEEGRHVTREYILGVLQGHRSQAASGRD
jgi:hypothetical protein